MSSEIVNEVMRHIDFKFVAEEITKKILSDDEFLSKVKDRVHDSLTSNGYQSYYSIQGNITAKVSDLFIEKHGQEILNKIDMQAVLNGIAFKAASSFSKKFDKE